MSQNPSVCPPMNSCTKMEVLLDHLPDDVVIDILTRLPARTLIRFRCVCKIWCDIIMDSTFAATYIGQSTKFHNFTRKNTKGRLIELIYCPTREGSLRDVDILFVEHEKWELPCIIAGTRPINIVGSCNGLICFTDDSFGRDIYLFNPSIRKLKAIPSAHIPSRYNVLGFGFDCLTNDFKVISILFNQKSNVSCVEVEVYSLSTNSWKKIATIVPYFTNDALSHTFVNGAFHWRASKEGLKDKLIMSFDFSNEVFSEILPPNCYIGAYEQNFFIMEFQKSLSLFSRYNDGGMTTCCIWMMKEYGMTESWTKQFTFSLQSRIDYPFCIAMSGEVLLKKRGYGELVSYDTVTQQSNDLEIDVWDAVTYVESLALLKEGIWGLGSYGYRRLNRVDDGFKSIGDYVR